MAAIPNPRRVEATTVAEAVLDDDTIGYSRAHKWGTAKATIEVTSCTHMVPGMPDMTREGKAMDGAWAIASGG